MKKRSWRRHIEDAMKQAGTFDPSFSLVIDSLAQILELRDDTLKQFAEEGGKISLERLNREGFPNSYKNPLIGVLEDLNKTALLYCRELGITARSLKAMNKDALRQKSSVLTGLLNDMTDDQNADLDSNPKMRS